VAREIEHSSNELWLSPLSIWESLLLAERGRVQLDGEPTRWMEDALRAFPVRDAPLTRVVALTSRSIDLPHQDPADRFIAASAIVYELMLVTADERLLASKHYRVLANRPRSPRRRGPSTP
jgi:PIN domain nuclease of toxin-antitoxin system